MNQPLRIGTSGYSYPGPPPKGWFGAFYPEPKPKRFDELNYYSQVFNTVEIKFDILQAAVGQHDHGLDEKNFI